MLKRRLLFVCLICALMLSSSHTALAGTAPPNNSPGGSVAPDPNSADAQASAEEISLVSQKIEIAVKAMGEATELTGSASDKVQAIVTSSYVLRNNFDSDITQGLSFPLSDLSGLKDAKGHVPEVLDFGLMVNGTPMSYTVLTRTNPYGDSEPPIKFAVFSTTLPAKWEVTISTTHTSPASGQMPVAKLNFALDTANAWAGRVGESEIIVRLPYPASRENVFLDESTPGGKFDEDTVRWVRRKFEPSSKDNFVVSLLAPQAWQAILDARAAAQANPTDAEAQRALAGAYQAALSLENGAPQGSTSQFVAQAEKAYAKAIALNPTSAELKVAYAQLLSDLHLAEDLGNPRRAAARLLQIVKLLQSALKLDPNNPAAIKLLAQMKTLAADVAKRNPSRAANALNAAVATTEQMIPLAAQQAAAAQATPAVAPSAEVTPVVSTTLTVSGPQATAVVAAQATVAAASAITGTPDAPQATAIAQAQVTLAAHATEMTIPTATAAANVAPAATSDSGQGVPSATNTNNTNAATFVGRMGLMSALSIACGVIILLGILAAVLVALFGRKQKVEVKSEASSNPPKES